MSATRNDTVGYIPLLFPRPSGRHVYLVDSRALPCYGPPRSALRARVRDVMTGDNEATEISARFRRNVVCVPAQFVA